MKNISGPVVEGEDFFGRERDIARMLDLLQHHDVLLLGPRRIGKTSLSRKVLARLDEQKCVCIEVNAASCADEREFVLKLVAAVNSSTQTEFSKVMSGLKAWARAQLDRIESVDLSGAAIQLGSVETDWTALANGLLKQMAQAHSRWLIYVDELPNLLYSLIKIDEVNGVSRVRRFLDWFRNDARNLPGCKQVRWLLTGSIGLDTLTQREGMAATINSLRHEQLAPFSIDEATQLLLALSQSYTLKLSPEHIAQLISAVGWPQPYYLQLVFQQLRRLVVEKSDANLSQLIDEAVQATLQPGSDNDFHHWTTRLRQQLGETDAAHAMALLTLAAQSSKGIRAESLLAKLQERMADSNEDAQRQKFIELRDILLRDAYWAAHDSDDGRRYAFCLELLRSWWQRRNQL